MWWRGRQWWWSAVVVMLLARIVKSGVRVLAMGVRVGVSVRDDACAGPGRPAPLNCGDARTPKCYARAFTTR